uniref:WGS project CBMI000000000 data, contig CS3069_c001854 n=1 Tax=Fusarium clavum TaxID=2594811 RepID=A0A090MI91_9HYPO|nr:unnamed protein product [Fusarium clavum]
MSTILHPPEPRPELERRQSVDIPEADEVSSVIADVSSRIEEATPTPETSKVQERISSTEQSETPSTTIQNGGIAFTTSIESGSSQSETENGNGHLESGGGGLSTGALAGIGVVAGVIVLAALVAIWWFSKRYKVSRRTKNVDGGGQSAEQQIYEAPDNTKASQQIYEAPDTTNPPQHVYEAPDTSKAPDKLHKVPKYELQG